MDATPETDRVPIDVAKVETSADGEDRHPFSDFPLLVMDLRSRCAENISVQNVRNGRQ